MTAAPVLSPTLRDLVAADRHSRPPVGRLARTQVDTLVSLVHGELRVPEAVSIRRALTVLAIGAPAEISVPVLLDVAGDPAADRPDRVAALHGLARVGTPEAQTALLSRVVDPHPRLQQAALAALGLFGDRAAGLELARLREPSDLATRRQLHFTRALIAHRSGAAGPFLPPVQPAAGPLDGPRTLQLRRRTAAQSTADRAALVGPTYGIEPAATAYGLVCGPTRWTLLTNAALGEPMDAERFTTRPWIVGLLCRWLPPGIAAASQYVLLSHVDGDGLRLDGVRADGVVAFGGRASLDAKGLEFTLAEVPRPGAAALRVAGRLTRRGALTATGTSVDRRTPARVARSLGAG